MVLYEILELFKKITPNSQILLQSFENSLKIKSLQISDSIHSP